MTSASSSSAKQLFSDSKSRLAERVNQNVNNIGSVARQIVRGSKTNEILSHALKSMVQCEILMDNSATTLHKVELIRQHIGYQHEAIQESCEQLDYLCEQVRAMER